MEFALALRTLWARRLWVLPGLILALIFAVVATYKVSLFPPSFHKRALQYSTATTQVYVDSHASALASDSANEQPLVLDSNNLAHLMATPAMLDLAGKYAGIPGGEIYAAGPIEPNLTRFVQEPSEGARAAQVTGEADPYRLEFDDDTIVPVISISSQAPTTAEAIALANGSVRALETYMHGLVKSAGTPLAKQVTVRQLGAPQAGVSDSGIIPKMGLLVFVGFSIFWCAMVLLLGRFRKTWKQSGELASLREALGTQDAQDQLSWNFGELALPQRTGEPADGDHESEPSDETSTNGHRRELPSPPSAADRRARTTAAVERFRATSEDDATDESPVTSDSTRA
jgi:hypothetical protein